LARTTGTSCQRDESTIRLLLADRKEESLTVYTDEFRAYDLRENDDSFTREYVIYGDGEYANGEVHINDCESHASLNNVLHKSEKL
jgi:transposase-like protein